MRSPQKTLSRAEFIALTAMMMATIAFSTDAMLPAFPEIARELTPAEPNRAQLIISFFLLGMAIGTLFVGPLADAFGRKPVIAGAATLFCTGAIIAWFAPTLEMLLLGRILQGIGAAGPRVVTVALVRDLFSGREMARIYSFMFLIFSLVPAIAPTIGYVLISWTGWRAIFLSFVVFSLICTLWMMLRQPETLALGR